MKDLHRRTLGDVWRWAGKYRKDERNIGNAFWDIPVALRQLLDDTKAWIEFGAYPCDEIAVFSSPAGADPSVSERQRTPLKTNGRFVRPASDKRAFPGGNACKATKRSFCTG